MQHYQWDFLDRLVGVEVIWISVEVAFLTEIRYDAFNRMIQLEHLYQDNIASIYLDNETVNPALYTLYQTRRFVRGPGLGILQERDGTGPGGDKSAKLS